MIILGDCLEQLKTLEPNSVDSIVTDPPYGLSFMGKKWDYDVPSVDIWQECLRVLKPGGYLLAFAGTRTQHRMAVNIEDAGFEIRDMIAWVYGSGFPKSLNIGKAVDKLDAVEKRNERRLMFTEWMRNTGITSDKVVELTGKSSNGNHLLASNLNNACVAVEEDFVNIRKHLSNKNIEVPEWIEKLVYERTVESENFKKREIVGKTLVNGEEGTAGGYQSGIASLRGADISMQREINITKGNSEWEGWGTALKPALEPITVARKPLSEKTVAENVLKWGTGGINIDGSRVEVDDSEQASFAKEWDRFQSGSQEGNVGYVKQDGEYDLNQNRPQGRFPANLIHDGSDEVVSLFPETGKSQSGSRRSNNGNPFAVDNEKGDAGFGDSGSAARFFKQCELTEEDIWEQEKLDQTVKSAINQSDLCETPTAQEAVKTQNLDSKTETLPASQDSISNSNDYSQHQNPVQIVATQESIDTTQTIQNSLKSSGSVHPVIDVPINQVNPNSDNAPKRFLYQPKASKADRDEGLEGFEDKQSGSFDGNADIVNTNRKIGEHPDKPNAPRKNTHPTVKPTKLMQYLVKLVTPKGGVVLDPFMGSGSTGKACKLEGFDFIGIEREAEYIEIAKARIDAVQPTLL